MARYKVQPDETLSQIASRFKLSPQAILKANPGVTRFSAGMGVNIPFAASANEMLRTKPQASFNLFDTLMGRGTSAQTGQLAATPYNTSSIPVGPHVRPAPRGPNDLGSARRGVSKDYPLFEPGSPLSYAFPEANPIQALVGQVMQAAGILAGEGAKAGRQHVLGAGARGMTPFLQGAGVEGAIEALEAGGLNKQAADQIRNIVSGAGAGSSTKTFKTPEGVSYGTDLANIYGSQNSEAGITAKVAQQIDAGNIPSSMTVSQTDSLGYTQTLLDAGWTRQGNMMIAPNSGGGTDAYGRPLDSQGVGIGGIRNKHGSLVRNRGQQARRDEAAAAVAEAPPGYGLVQLNWRT